jgi:hypothetical protein
VTVAPTIIRWLEAALPAQRRLLQRFPIKITFALRRAGEHYWKALWCVETALVQEPENAMQKR